LWKLFLDRGNGNEVITIKKYISFTDAQKQEADSVDLETFLLRRGERLLSSGRDKRLASDHSVTIRGNEWFDHAVQLGGHAISFVQRHYGLDYQQAVLLLLGKETGEPYPTAKKQAEIRKPFALPPRHTNMRQVFAYLVDRRRIDRDILHHFTHNGLVYEDIPYHNVVFVGLDEHGVPRHAHRRSTNSQGRIFRQNTESSNPQYSFHHVGTSENLYVFEAPIDLLSFLTLRPDRWQEHSYVALCGTGRQAMDRMLSLYPQLRHVYLCLDNDRTGQNAANRLANALRPSGYNVDILVPQHKDWNDDLTAAAIDELSDNSRKGG
jgi:hypothetical protein